MPSIKYETEVRPPVYNFTNGALIDPGGPGRCFIVLPDGSPLRMDKASRIKVEEAAPPSRCETPDIKSEDEDEGISMTLTARSYETARSYLRNAASTSSTPCRPRHKEQQSRVKNLPSDESSSDDSDTSSYSSDSDVSDYSSSEAEASDVCKKPLPFRASKPLASIVDGASSTSRSRSYVKKDDRQDSQYQKIPCPPSKKTSRPERPQHMSVATLPSLSFYMPIRQTDCQSVAHTVSSVGPSMSAPTPRPQSIASPVSSRVNGWKPINKQRKTTESSSTLRQTEQKPAVGMRGAPTAPASMRGDPLIVFVCNIPYALPEEQLRELLRTAGDLVDFRYNYHRDTGRALGFGLAEYSNANAAASAVRKFDGYEIMGRKLHADFHIKSTGSGNNDHSGTYDAHHSHVSSRLSYAPATRPRAFSQYPQPKGAFGRQYRAATAGPSTLPSQQQSSPAQSSPKGKGNGKAIATFTSNAESSGVQQDDTHQPDAGQPKSKKRKSVKNHGKGKKRKTQCHGESAVNAEEDEQRIEAYAQHSIMRGPPRYARVERSVEESPCAVLPTPEPSSAVHKRPQTPKTSSTRAESSMFVSSPAQLATPSPQRSCSPTGSSPPGISNRKRSRSVFEDPAHATLVDAVKKALQDFKTTLTADRSQTEKRTQAQITEEADRREKKMQADISHMSTEFQAQQKSLKQGINQQLADQRSERERVEKGIEEQVSSVRNEERHARKRLESATAEQDGRITTLHAQFKVSQERIEKKVNGQGGVISIVQARLQTQVDQTQRLQKKMDGNESRVTTLQSRVDGQTARSRSIDSKIETNAQKIDDVGARVVDLGHKLDTIGTHVEKHGSRFEELGSRIGGQKRELDARIDDNVDKLERHVARINAHSQKLDAQKRENDELKQRMKRLEDGERTSNVSQEIILDRIRQLEAGSSAGRDPNFGGPKPPARYVRPRESSDTLRGGLFPKKAVIPDTFTRKQYGGVARHHGLSASRVSQGGGSASSVGPSQGALDHNTLDADEQTSQPRSLSGPSPSQFGSAHDVQSSEANSHPERGHMPEPHCSPLLEPGSSSPAKSHRLRGIQPSPAQPIPSQLQPPSSLGVGSRVSLVQIALPRRPQRSHALQPCPTSPRPLPLSQQEMRDLVLSRPMSGLAFTIPYDTVIDSDQTSAATAFLLNVPLQIIVDRFRQFLTRPAFSFNLDDPDVCGKGCWAVRIERAQEGQLKLYYGDRNHSYALARLAVRIWHDEDSVLRLLLSKSHEAVRVCHNKSCFNPDHIVVESRKEARDRRPCGKDGYCGGHAVWSKCGRMEERRMCILT
ncbi:unnamed protein product [Discula destructiva]